jgi:hypothetical protein
MSDIIFKLKLNKGRHGIVFHKLARIAEEAEKFLASFAEDVHLTKTDWVADTFRNGSLEFNLNYIGNENPAIMLNARRALAYITDPKTKPESLNHGISPKTFHQFARIANPLESDDSVGFGIPNDRGRFITRILTKERAVQIERETNQILEHYAGFQGSVTALFREGTFWLKDYISGKRIVCQFRPHLYSKIWKLLDENEELVNVEGWLVSKNGTPETLRVEHVNPSIGYEEGDLDKFFGCDPNFTGDLTTEQFLDELRGE